MVLSVRYFHWGADLGPVYLDKSWPGHPSHPPPRANRVEPSFPTIAYTSLSTVYMRNCKPGSRGRVTLEVGSLGWQDRVTLGGETTCSHVNGFKRVNSPSWSKSGGGGTSLRKTLTDSSLPV